MIKPDKNIQFKVNCPYCQTEQEYFVKEVKKIVVFKNHWVLSPQYIVDCKTCGHRLYLTTNFKNSKYSILAEEEDTDA